MFKMEDLRLGMKVLVFGLYLKTCNTATVVGLTMDGDITVEYNGKKEQLYRRDYKRNDCWWNCGTVWCFPNATKYIEHVQKQLHKEDFPRKKKIFADYDKYPHDNNKKQLEARLNKQRTFITKVMEQGYVYYVTYDSCGNRVWRKLENPRIEFRGNKYFVYTPCGDTCANKEGKTLSLTN